MEFLQGIPKGIWLGVCFGIPAAVVLFLCKQKPPFCPQCKEQQKFPRWPSSLHQAMYGGWNCHKCGCKLDGKGKELVS